MERPSITSDSIRWLRNYIERHPRNSRRVILLCRAGQRQRQRIINQAKRDGYFQHWGFNLRSIHDHPVVRDRDEYKAVADYGRWLEKQPVQQTLL